MSEEIYKTAEDYLRGKYGAYRGSFTWRDEEKAFNAGILSQADLIKELEAGLASQAQQIESNPLQLPAPEPLLTLILGGIEGDEYSANDIEWHTKAVEALQEKLVRGSDAVFVPLYLQSQAQQESQAVAWRLNKFAEGKKPSTWNPNVSDDPFIYQDKRMAEHKLEEWRTFDNLPTAFLEPLYLQSQTQQPDWLLKSTQDLATSLWQKHYKSESPVFEVLNDLAGVISQIDNMTTGLVRLQSQAQQTESKPALKVVHGEICYQSTDDDQSYGMWCPVSYDTKHSYRDGTKFIVIPPAPEGE